MGNFGQAVLGGLGKVTADSVGGLVGQVFTGANARREWKYKQKEMALAQQYNFDTMAKEQEYAIENWDRENAYNNPSAVASRYSAAGISKQAAFGQGAAGGSGISGSLSTPSGHSPSASGSYSHSPQFSGGENPYFAALQLKMQKDLTESQVELNEANAKRALGETKDPGQGQKESESQISLNAAKAALSDSQTALNETTNRLQSINVEIAEATKQDNIDQVFAKTVTMWEQLKIAGEQANQERFETEHQKEQYLANLAKIRSETSRNMADAALSWAKEQTEQKRPDEIDSMIKANEAEARKKGFEGDFQEWYNDKKRRNDFTGSDSEWQLLVSQMAANYGKTFESVMKGIMIGKSPLSYSNYKHRENGD